MNAQAQQSLLLPCIAAVSIAAIRKMQAEADDRERARAEREKLARKVALADLIGSGGSRP